MFYCNSLEPAELPSRSKSVEIPGEFGSIATQPRAAGFMAKRCAWHSVLPLHTSDLLPTDHTQACGRHCETKLMLEFPDWLH